MGEPFRESCRGVLTQVSGHRRVYLHRMREPEMIGYSPTEAFGLIFVDDDETARRINITIEQSGGCALTFYGEFLAWSPERLSVDEAVAWAVKEISEQSGVDVDEISATSSPNWR